MKTPLEICTLKAVFYPWAVTLLKLTSEGYLLTLRFMSLVLNHSVRDKHPHLQNASLKLVLVGIFGGDLTRAAKDWLSLEQTQPCSSKPLFLEQALGCAGKTLRFCFSLFLASSRDISLQGHPPTTLPQH